MKYIIRLANENDLSGLCNIRNNKDLFTNYLKQFAIKETYLAIAEQNARLLGSGVLKLNGTLIPKLSDLYVKEEYRCNGIGSGLIRYRENIARDLGYHQIFVSVDPVENPEMIKLIKRHGYESISDQYLKKAIFYNDDGTTYEKTYTRIDLKKMLN
ncbi:GNAT family N-acetyltransferase [Bacillus sp. FJAT-45066]|uniref:GNAT family N-acetyltransferase n=1 Tax=Bacillus sp. FJAT-45066 TaxID=2011010 RepID=UPI000BB88A7A|nr:GNAT family N-acetyltransferase [Bacillus sp. FJAT-45066]